MSRILFVFVVFLFFFNQVLAQSVVVSNPECENDTGEITISVESSGDYWAGLKVGSVWYASAYFSSTHTFSGLPENTYRVFVYRRIGRQLSIVYNRNRIIEIDDTSKPVFLNPQTDILVNADDGKCGKSVDFVVPDAVDNCAVFSGTIPGFNYMGEFNGHTYYYSNNSVDVNTAIQTCESHGGHLVTITNQAENNFVNDKVGRIWIGFTDQTTEGEFVWLTGESSTYTNWNGGEPSDSRAGEDYAEMLDN